MRYLLAACIVFTLALAPTAALTADEERPEGAFGPAQGDTLEVREVGYAVTFPEDWVVETVEEDPDFSILVVSGPERFGPEVELQNLLVAWGPGGRGTPRETVNLCTLVRYEPIELTADEFMDEVYGQSDLPVESLHEGLSRVLVNQWMTGRVLTDDPEAIYADQYAIGTDGAVAFLWCTGVLSHRGDWLSIAESFEFLSAAE